MTTPDGVVGTGSRNGTPSLFDVLGDQAQTEGVNDGLWPGSFTYRMSRPSRLYWNEIRRLSVGVIVRSPRARAHFGAADLSAHSSYVVFDGTRHVDCLVVATSPEQPVLALVLPLDTQQIRTVAASMRGAVPAAGQIAASDHQTAVPELDAELADAFTRFLASLVEARDRQVLAPLHLQELVYRLVQRNDDSNVLALASRQPTGAPIATVVDYIATHLAEALTVDSLAAQACLSPSAFSRAFRGMTGQSPYQFVKTLRLERAQLLLDEGRLGVADVARAVGYTSVSHFIREFRGRFGITPGTARTTLALTSSVSSVSSIRTGTLTGSRCVVAS
ncbi:AraC family transcriptional regulator [Mycobacterium sp. ITM-2016-00317]|uniref:AraC family transcriptional regulator n=1 Tax=Mycobacterium sp. ITM-2016-00317 TaxID=2099694 RepID=UPI00287F74EC|nr:AraC family transcriptional regulator [Mycobacterium sp. ITM-2016-00317]WNG87612.1 AraC family transcriptional regulator [Mycobacterium sp. ITM-2016-00317]